MFLPLIALHRRSENAGPFCVVCTVGQYDCCSDHEQIDNHRVTCLMLDVASKMAQLMKEPLTSALCGMKRFYSFHKIKK
jgi:hypothetical protein